MLLSTGKREQLRDILRRRIQILKLRRLKMRRILVSTGDVLRFRQSCQRQLNSSRGTKGEHHTLFEDLRSMDPETHFEYFRMYKEDFDEILAMVKPLISHPPNHRVPIRATERLALTLR